jgi:hypothetical protein
MAPARGAREHGCVHFYRFVSSSMLAAAAALLAACQSLPAEEMSRARAMVEGATLASVGRSAAPELARSRQKVALAQRWIDAGDYGPARWLAEQAEVDAELALARRAYRQPVVALAPAHNIRIEQMRSAHARLLSGTGAPVLAPAETQRALEALERAVITWESREDPALVDHLAYVARQRAEIAAETARRIAAERALASPYRTVSTGSP